MKGCLITLFWGFVVLASISLIYDNSDKGTSTVGNDSNRAVDHYDYDRHRYIYKDELPLQDTLIDCYTKAEVDELLKKERDKKNVTIWPRDIIIEGKRYEVKPTPHGDAKLIPTR